MAFKEILMLMAAIVGVLISLRKMHIVCTIISAGMLAGITLWLIGIETIETSVYFGFVFLALLIALFQKGIPVPARWVLGVISAFVFAGEVSLFMQYPFEQYLRYAMIIPVLIYFSALLGRPKVNVGWGCMTIMVVDAAYIFFDAVF